MPRFFAAVRSALIGGLFVGRLFGVDAGWADDWPGWRGPEADNHADPANTVPRSWNLDTGQNVVWKTLLQGRGHSTPIVVEDAILLTSSDVAEQSQSLVKLDRDSGRLLDRWEIHRGKLPARIHPHNTFASPSPAYDGERVFVAFHHDDAIWLTAMSTSGRQIWQRRVCEFTPAAFQFGYGASPIVESDLVIVAAEYDGADSGLYAFDVRTGKPVWKTPRPRNLNFASPIVGTIAGRRELLLAGADKVCAYDPLTGREYWSVDAATEAICGTVVWDGRHVLISGGNPEAGAWCVQAAGTTMLRWDKPVMCYEQSLLAAKGYVFAVADNGVAYCWRIHDGQEMWKHRLFGGGISASPLLVDDELIVASEAGEVFTIAAIPDRFQLLATNQAGKGIFASPVVVDQRLYLRTANDDGSSETLVAIGTE